jgi:flagellar biosynthesis chaperone FliJ
MSRFRFRLQPVLDVRERVQDERQRDLALKKRDLVEAETALAALEADRDDQRAALVRGHRAIEDQAVRVSACGDEVDRAKAKLVAANTDRKVLETLRTRRRDAFNAEVAQAEQREVDDQNARRYGRAQTERGERS